MGSISSHLTSTNDPVIIVTRLRNLTPSIAWFGGRHFTHPLCSGYLSMNQIVTIMQTKAPNPLIFRTIAELDTKAYALLSKCHFVFRLLTSIKQFLGNATQFARQRNTIISENEGTEYPGLSFQCYRSTYIPRQTSRSQEQTQFTVANAQTLIAATTYRDQNPVILDMAHAFFPGGCEGVHCQEEYLVANSITNEPHHAGLKETLEYAKKLRTPNKEELLYSEEPFIPENGCLYIPGTKYRIVRNVNSFLTVPTICAAAPDYSVGGKGAPIHQRSDFEPYRQLMKDKIRSILFAARINNHQSLILGALGCEAFANEPDYVAQFFKEVFDEEFRGVFKNVCFAIYDNERAETAFKRIFIK